MAFIRKPIIPAATVALVLCLAVCTPADAVNLKNVISGKARAGPAFAELSLATASKAEVQSALQAEIQEQVLQGMAAAIAEELASSGDLVESVKGVASDALGEFLGSMKESMGETCKRFADVAQSKMDSLDSKLGRIAGDDDGSTPTGAEGSAPYPLGPYTDPTGPYAESAYSPYQYNENPYQYTSPYTAQNRYPVNDQRVAWLQVELRDKHKGFFSSLKNFAKKGIKKLKTFGGVVKKGVSSIWSAVKPAVATGVRSVVSKIKAQIPNVIGQACNAAEDKIESVESKLVGPTEP